MRVVLCTFFLFLSTTILAQERDAIPPRFQSFAKDGRLQLKRILGAPEMHPTFNPSMAFTADGKRAVYVEDLTTGPEDKLSFRARVHVWNIETKAWPREFEIAGKNVTSLSLSADGKKALVAGETLVEKEKVPHAYFGLWDLETGKEISSQVLTERNILASALSPDESTALIGTGGKALHALDLKKKGAITMGFARNARFGVTALAYLPGGKQFLAGYGGGETRLFDITKEKPVKIFPSKDDSEIVWNIALSRDAKRFATSDVQDHLKLWDVAGNQVGQYKLDKRTIEEVITALAIADDGKTVISVWSKAGPEPDDMACAKIMAWDAEANKTLWTHPVPYRGRVPILVQGDKLLVGGGPNRFDVWSIKTGKLEQSWGGHKGPVHVLGVLQSGDILSGGLEGTLITWRDGKITAKAPAHKGAFTAMALHKDKKEWLTAGADLLIRRGPEHAKLKSTFTKKHTGPITSLAWSSTNAWAASGSADRTARTWAPGTGTEIDVFQGHPESVNAVAVSPDDRWLATGSDDTTIKLWPVKNGKLDPDRDVMTLEKHTKPVTCLAFTSDGKRLISGSQDQKLMVWDVQKGTMDFMIPGHKNWITSILLLNDTTVVTASDDLSICVWDLKTGMELARVDFGGVGDCPRCLARMGPGRILVGTSSWLIYEFQLMPDAKTK